MRNRHHPQMLGAFQLPERAAVTARLYAGLVLALLATLSQHAAAQQCSSPDAQIMSTPIRIDSCEGKQEVIFNGVDQVYSTDAGVVVWLGSESFGYSGSATGGLTGAVAWTHVTSNQLSATSYEDLITMTPSFAGAGQSVDLVQTITYSPGSNFFEMRWDLTNNTSTSIANVRLIMGCDVLVQGDDGSDRADDDWAATRTIGCWDDTPAPAVFEGFSGLRMIGDASVSAMHYFTQGYGAMWNQVRSGTLPDTSDPAAYDQGVAIQYNRASNLAAGQTWSVRNIWTFDLPPIVPTLVLTSTCLPCATPGLPYSQTLSAMGGIQPYSWAALSALPPGLNLNPVTGELSGILTTPGAYMFTIQVTDSNTPPSTDSVIFNFDGDCPQPCAVGICGDCDDDGFVNIIDALNAVRVSSGLAPSPTGVAFANCDVFTDGFVSVLDGLWVAQWQVGLRPLNCCPGTPSLQRPLACGQEYCGEFTAGDPTHDLNDFATTHFFGLSSAQNNASYRVSIVGTGDFSLFVGDVGTTIGATTAASYAFSDTGLGGAKTILIDSTTTPDASLFWGGPLAVAVHAITPGSYTVRIDCVCYSADISATGMVISDTNGGLNLLSSSCGGAGFPELVYTYDVTAPGNDVTFSTDFPSTTYDSILTIADGCTSGFMEFDCDDNSGSGTTSIVTLNNAAVGTYYIIVDGTGAGPFELRVTETPSLGVCAGTVDGTIPASGPWPHIVNGTTMGADNTAGTTCGAGSSPDRIYQFSPSASSLYDIDLCGGTLFDSVLQVRLVDCVSGASVACNDNSCLTASEISGIMLDAGFTYYIIVDGNSGAAGPFSLQIKPRGVCTGTVEADVSGMALPITYNDTIVTGSDNTTELACNGLMRRDHVVAYTPTVSGFYDVTTCGSTLDTVLAAFAYHCSAGQLLGCDNDSCGAQSQLIGLALTAGTTYYFAIEGSGGAVGSYQLDIVFTGAASCGPACAGTVDSVLTGTPIPLFDGFFLDPMVMDDTFGPNQCAAGGLDFVYEWSPPADDSYTISLCGSSFDTVLEIRECNCDPAGALGRVVGCSDDTGPCAPQSQIQLNLRAGIVYYIMIEDPAGFGGIFFIDIQSP